MNIYLLLPLYYITQYAYKKRNGWGAIGSAQPNRFSTALGH